MLPLTPITLYEVLWPVDPRAYASAQLTYSWLQSSAARGAVLWVIWRDLTSWTRGG